MYVLDQFVRRGGTELGTLSTTSDQGVAIKYSRSNRSLIFKILTENQLQRGTGLQWLSIFPQLQPKHLRATIEEPEPISIRLQKFLV